MEALFNPCLSRLMWVAGSVVILSNAASIAVVLAWSPIPISSHSVTPSSSAVPTPAVVTKAYTTTPVPLTSAPLEESLEMMALLNLHRYARNRILTQDDKIAVRFEDTSCVFQKTVWNLAD
ncbi:MAG: hypothetical protein QG599_3386 [Pseudomonadota bacterium]|nr:hypothetical protein [Pseudomonadota bacterium]